MIKWEEEQQAGWAGDSRWERERHYGVGAGSCEIIVDCVLRCPSHMSFLSMGEEGHARRRAGPIQDKLDGEK
jgi:hypothetical protein